jgi:hypothetical protein
MMVIDNRFNFGDVVYLVTDVDQNPRILTRIVVSRDSVIYELSCGERISSHYDIEITSEKNVLLNTSN